MTRRLSIFVAVLFALLLCSCRQSDEGNKVSMLVTQGFDEKFFRTLAEDVKKDLGIDVEFVYECSVDQSEMLLNDFRTNDLKADIIFTYAKIRNDYLKGCCLDLMSRSNLMSHYSYGKIREFMTEDGCAYELPLLSRLVGITVNATLMEEMGWEMPNTFDDMLSLKKKCDNAGITFAVTDLKYTGSGFNIFFHTMGSQWLFTVKGKSWLDGFLEGLKTLQPFKEEAEYFRKWVDNGLFGDLADFSAPAAEQFGRKRALFCYMARSDKAGYSGPKYDKYGNKTDIILNDKYKSMPWISEDGSNNCYTKYDNCWAMVNKSVGDNPAKLASVLSILEYMMSEKYSSLALDLAPDIYSAFNESYIREDRLYYDYADKIRSGFLQPWYYNMFDITTVIETGEELNSYIFNTYRQNGWNVKNFRKINYDINPNATFDTAIGMLRNSLHAQKEDYLGWAEERVESPDVARMTAISSALALQEQLPDEEVKAALMPYVRSLAEMQPWIQIPVMNLRVNPGILEKGFAFIFEPPKCIDIVGVRMTGAELKEIVSAGYDPSGYFIDAKTGESTFDSEHYGPYQYALETKGGAAIEDGREYLVALCPLTLSKQIYDDFVGRGKVVTVANGDISPNLARGVELYFKVHPTISSSNIYW